MCHYVHQYEGYLFDIISPYTMVFCNGFIHSALILNFFFRIHLDAYGEEFVCF